MSQLAAVTTKGNHFPLVNAPPLICLHIEGSGFLLFLLFLLLFLPFVQILCVDGYLFPPSCWEQ